MTRLRIADLMAGVFVIAVGLAALATPSATWAGGVSMVAAGAILVAALGATIRRGETRASHLGFAVFGAAYCIVSLAPWFSREVGTGLPTSRLFDEAFAHVRAEPPRTATTGRITFWDYYTRRYIALGPYSFRTESRDHFRRSGHALAALAAGLVGSLIGRWHHRQHALADRGGEAT